MQSKQHRSKQNRLSLAVRLALSVTLASAVTCAYAQDASTSTPPAPPKKQDQKTTQDDKAKDTSKDTSKDVKALSTVEVTGSLIRRVDTETANPVVTLDRAALTNDGNLTMGNVLQALPSFSGFATNPQNNSNGGGVASPTLEGGDGASRLSLRGLGYTRTLMLVDGQRLANPDINMIPSNMIERVDVLAEGASTVYGSDAIGGVTNFILRKDFNGMEVSGDTGVSSNGDGQRRGITLTVGSSGDQGNIVGGLNYNKYDPVLATARRFSTYQYYLYSSGPQQEGSHTIPTGKVSLPGNNPLVSQLGCANLTRSSGNGSSLSDYRCFNNATDVFNYNAYNYLQTAQERTDAFVLGNYKLGDNVTYYIDTFYNRTHSSGQDGPPPTGTGDGWTVAADNPNNPFGVEFCNTSLPSCPAGSGSLGMRLTGAGTRLHTYDTDNITLITGLRGVFGDSSWTWDANINYGRSDRTQTDYHELNVAAMQAAIDAGGNPFDQTDLPVNVTDNPVYSKTNTSKQLTFNTSGELWQLPAGAVQLSGGVLYRKEYMNYTVTSDAYLDPQTLECGIAAEGCGSPGQGGFNVKEVFGETLIPLLADAPFAKSLNIDVGVRYSDYNTVGSTTNAKIALEWKPIEDLLVRGTVSQVFRAPDNDELYDGLTVTNPVVSDPCVGLSAAQLASHQNLCRYVPANWQPFGYGQIDGLYEGGSVAGVNLKPEHGKSFDFGLVYSPSWIEGLSGTLDFWHITLNDYLQPLTAQTVLNLCQANDNSPMCSYIYRNANGAEPGSIYYIYTPEANLGSLSTSGIDFNVAYVLPQFEIGGHDPGRFKVALNTTYTGTYKVTIPGAQTVNYAGTYSQQFGDVTRLRSSLTVNWTLANWHAQWQTRYIQGYTLLNAYYDVPGSLPIPSMTYNSATLGYTFPTLKTSLDFGIDNIGNRTPPLLYQNGTSVNTDTATYDLLGRYFWARATVKF